MIKFILILLLFALPLAINNHCYYTGAIKQSILFIGSIWIGYFLWLKKPKLPDYSVLLFMGWIVFSYLVSPFKSSDPLEALLTYFCYLTIYIAARDYFTQKNAAICMELIIYILIGLFIYTFWGKFQYVYSNLYNPKQFGLSEMRGTFGNVGIMACWLAMSIALLAVNKHIIPVLLGLGLLWLTGSRASIISAILALSVALAIGFKAKWKKIVIGIIGLLLVSGFFYKYADDLSVQQERISYWDSAIQMIIDKPIQGQGIGSFRIHYPKYKNSIVNDIFATL